eukprot:12123915-Prorocentrum_lima.AAC.1
MTSSLVGSEMCIRDSARTPQKMQNNPCQFWLGCLGCLAPKNSKRKPPLPVSYTHLTLPTICSV